MTYNDRYRLDHKWKYIASFCVVLYLFNHRLSEFALGETLNKSLEKKKTQKFVASQIVSVFFNVSILDNFERGTMWELYAKYKLNI